MQPVPVLAATPRVEDHRAGLLDGVGRGARQQHRDGAGAGRRSPYKINFKDGQDAVNQGDVLAEIDPVLFKAQLDQAVAKKAQDEAQLANARLDLDRYRRLRNRTPAARQQADTQATTVAQLEALVQADLGCGSTPRRRCSATPRSPR